MRIVVTGFPAFADVTRNPSEKLIATLREEKWSPSEECAVRYTLLPMKPEALQTAVQGMFLPEPPDYIFHFGVAVGAEGFRLELSARNVLQERPLNNQSVIITSQKSTEDVASAEIIEGGQRVLHNELPIKRMQTALTDNHLHSYISDDAGMYFCNMVSYLTAHEIEQKGYETSSGFIHVPLLEGDEDIAQRCRVEQPFFFSEDQLVLGAKSLITACLP